jgi:septum formation protein
MSEALLWSGPPLVLASASPTRRGLLEAAGLPVEVEASGVDERALDEERLSPADLARRLAAAKALAVSRRRPDRLVLGADQTLGIGDLLFHKPSSRDEAAAQLRHLSGRTHRLVSAACLARGGSIRAEIQDSADLTLRPLTEVAIERYLALAGEQVFTSVGGYQVEGLGLHLFERIEGAQTTILGLPLLPLLAALRLEGALLL